MRIKKLHIKNYKNLDADLVHNSDLIAFIGNNGSGKSNILEAVSIIFYHLYNKKEKDIPFNFTLEYEIGGNKLVSIEKKNSSVTTKVDNVHKTEVTGELPRQVIAIYSGEEDRLWRKSYAPFYFEYIKNINAADNSKLGEFIQFPKMLFINKFYWHISLLCLLISDDSKIQEFCNQILNIKKINSIKFQFNKSNYDNYSESPVKNFIRNIDAKSEYSISDLKKVIAKHNYTTSEVYKNLYIAFTPDKKKMLENIILKFNDENLEVEDLSEGEKKLLLIKGALEYAGQEDSVFILDEPDSHIHINNKEQITNSFKDYLHNRQIIITTHSPTLTQCVNDENVYMLNNGRIEDRSRQEIIEEVTGEFWNKHQQSSFLSSKKPIILLVEGKHDKEHINNAYNALKEDFKNLDFEIFKLNTETNIQPFLRGLYESEFDTTKIYIGLFDREAKILNDFNNRKNYSKIENKSFCKIIESDKINNNYFATALPEIDDKKCDCSIEMMYNYEKWENAYKKAVENTIGKTSNKSIKEYSEDVLNDAKNILSENSKEFGKEDFKHFKKLFELITEIKEYSNGLSSPKKKPKKVTPVAAPIAPETTPTKEIIEIHTKRRGTNIVAHFDPSSEKVTIQAGSIISTDVVPSYKANEKTERNRLKKKHCEFVDDKWTVKTPIDFASPSGAIKFGVGSNINGWKYWLLKDTKAELETIRKK
jgi:ABC-type cobalamin/Fe3+-siderophores transport system ATPase subunit